jgi:hypothetical protein
MHPYLNGSRLLALRGEGDQAPRAVLVADANQDAILARAGRQVRLRLRTKQSVYIAGDVELLIDFRELFVEPLVERLAEVDNTKRSYRYTLVSGVPASHYAGVIDVKPKASGSVAEWRVEFLANNQPDIAVRTMVSRLVETGLGSLKTRFGVPHDDAH